MLLLACLVHSLGPSERQGDQLAWCCPGRCWLAIAAHRRRLSPRFHHQPVSEGAPLHSFASGINQFPRWPCHTNPRPGLHSTLLVTYWQPSSPSPLPRAAPPPTKMCLRQRLPHHSDAIITQTFFCPHSPEKNGEFTGNFANPAPYCAPPTPSAPPSSATNPCIPHPFLLQAVRVSFSSQCLQHRWRRQLLSPCHLIGAAGTE